MTRLLLLACLALAGCLPVIPVPAPEPPPTPCECECAVDDIVLQMPIPDYVWQEMLDEWKQEQAREPDEYPAGWEK